MPTPDPSTHVPYYWQNFADKNATGADSFGRMARRLIVGGAGSVYLIPVAGGAEQLFLENCPAGMVITQQFAGIGATTSATDLCVQFG